MTPRDLAALLGYKSNVQVSQWEKNRRQPELASMSKIAGALGVSVNWLFRGEGTPPEPITADVPRGTQDGPKAGQELMAVVQQIGAKVDQLRASHAAPERIDDMIDVLAATILHMFLRHSDPERMAREIAEYLLSADDPPPHRLANKGQARLPDELAFTVRKRTMGPMKALDFFQEMVSAFEANGADDPQYKEMEAAMLVYKVADQALHRGRLQQSVEIARHHVARLNDLVARNRLMGMLDDTDPDRPAFPDRLYASFLVYGIEKHNQGQFGAAVTAFRTVLPTTDVDLRLTALQRIAWSLRLARQFPEAIKAYDDLEMAAVGASDIRRSLEAHLGRAKVAIDQGKFEFADAMLESVVRKGKSVDERALVAKAYIDRARLAGIQGDHLRAVQYSYAALPDLDVAVSYERALANMAHGMRELHRTEQATELARWLSKRTKDMVQKAELCVLLYHLAIDSHDWIAADGYRHMLSGFDVNPEVVAQYQLALSRHDAGQENWASAAQAVAEMQQIATDNHLPELLASATRAAQALQDRNVPEIYPEGPQVTPAEIEAVMQPIEADLLDLRQRDRLSA